VDFDKLPTRPDNPYVVGVYEKKGVDGKRYVLRFPLGVKVMTDEQWKKAVFPPGYPPPPGPFAGGPPRARGHVEQEDRPL
jgi:hypothetical protein